LPGFGQRLRLIEEALQSTTMREWVAALAGGLFVAQVAFLVCGHPRASGATFLLFTALFLVIRYRQRKKKV
jgi:hypothetical protein